MKRKIFFNALMVMAVMALNLGLSQPARAAQAQWTFLVYLDADNNLESAGIDDFLEMSSVSSSSEVNIVVQFDRIPGYASSYGDWKDTKRFLVAHDMTPTAGNALPITLGELNMGNPQTLIDFVQWGMTTYPADHYAVVLWDHGSGWRLQANQWQNKGVAYDSSSGNDGLEMDELRAALNTLTIGGAQPIDLLGLDACLMAMIEVDNQMRPFVNVRVGSEETEPGDGWPYDTLLGELVADPAMSASQLGTIIVDEYYVSYGSDNTQSAVDLLSAYDSLNSAVNDFAAALINGMTDHSIGITIARLGSVSFTDPEFIDLYDFAHRINLAVSDAAINSAATNVMNAIASAVLHEHHGASWNGAYGISIYFPATIATYDSRYDGSSGFLQFTVNTQWDEWLRTFYASGSTPPPNDDFDNALVVGVPYDNLQEIGAATTAVDDPSFTCVTGKKYNTVWYQYIPAADGFLTVNTFGSNYDTVLAIWSGERGNLQSLACNDDASGFQSQVQLNVTAGATYYIEAASYDAIASGTLSLSAEQQKPIVDDTSYSIQYDGWTGGLDALASGGGYRSASLAGQTIAYKTAVSTRSFTLLTYLGPDQGQAQILVDGKVKKTLDLYSAASTYASVSVTGLPLAKHMITVKVSGTKNPLSTGTEVRVDGFLIGTTIIEDNSLPVKYTQWSSKASASANGGSYRYAAKAGSAARIKFTGTAFTWITTQGPSYGKAQIFVDGALLQTVDLYNTKTVWQYHLDISGLADAEHTVEIRVLGQHNPKSKGNTIIVDGFIY